MCAGAKSACCARTFPEQNGWPYAEFFLNANSVRKQLWVSEKSSEYRVAILNRISHFSGAT